MNPPSGLIAHEQRARPRAEYPLEVVQELLAVVSDGLRALHDFQFNNPVTATLHLVGKGAYSPHLVTAHFKDGQWHLVMRGGGLERSSCEPGQLLGAIRALCDRRGGCCL